MYVASMAGNRFVQYLAIISGSLLSFTCGINQGWTSPYIPILQNNETTPLTQPLTSDEVSWLAVMCLIGSPPGALLGAMLVDRIGRKNLLLAQSPFIAAGFLALAYAKGFWMLCVGRLLISATEGAIYIALPMYYGEIADPKIRGIMGSSITVAGLSGALFINIIGPFLTIFTCSWVCVVIPVLNFITFVWLPKSPYYLIKKNQLKSARKSLCVLRGSADVDTELKEITSGIERQEAIGKAKFTDLFTIPVNRRGILIYVVLSFTNKFSGMNPIVYYTTTIFETAEGNVDSLIAVISFNAIGVLATIISLGIVDHYGRRPLLLCSALGCALALASESIYFTIQVYQPDYLAYIGWLPISSLLTYNAIYCAGLAFGPVLFLSEIFSTAVKAKALGCAEIIAVVFGTLSSKFFHALSETFGMYVPFWCFAGFSVIGAVLVYFVVPETKGKTLEEIQLDLMNKNKT